MLEIIKSNNNIKAVLEFYVVNEKGEMDDNGIYCWINDCEVSKQYQNNGCLKKFIKIITSKYPQFQYGYFWRQRKYGNKVKMYSKRQWLKYANK